MRLRGTTSINATAEPLYVVDGIVLSNVAIPSNQNAVTRSTGGSNPNLTQDGQVLGYSVIDWNLPFARSLLDLLLERKGKKSADYGFVADWYHAVAAHLFAMGMYADARLHVQEAARLIPDDPRAWPAGLRGAEGLAATLRERRDDAMLYRTLARLRTDVPLAETLDDLRVRSG